MKRAKSEESYPIVVHNVGGKEPNGKPTRISRWTFETKMVRDVVLDALPKGRVLNSCSGEYTLNKRGADIIRNDLNPNINADHHEDVMDLGDVFNEESFDAVIHDPPFDAGRSEKLYEGFHASEYMKARQVLSDLIKPGGTFIELGWNSWGLADMNGWERAEHHLYRQPFKGDIHLVVDKKINQRTF